MDMVLVCMRNVIFMGLVVILPKYLPYTAKIPKTKSIPYIFFEKVKIKFPKCQIQHNEKMDDYSIIKWSSCSNLETCLKQKRGGRKGGKEGGREFYKSWELCWVLIWGNTLFLGGI